MTTLTLPCGTSINIRSTHKVYGQNFHELWEFADQQAQLYYANSDPEHSGSAYPYSLAFAIKFNSDNDLFSVYRQEPPTYIATVIVFETEDDKLAYDKDEFVINL